MVRCPAHDDRRPSLGVLLSPLNEVLAWRCFVCGRIDRELMRRLAESRGWSMTRQDLTVDVRRVSEPTYSEARFRVERLSEVPDALRDELRERGLGPVLGEYVWPVRVVRRSDQRSAYGWGLYVGGTLKQVCIAAVDRSAGWPRYLSFERRFVGVWEYNLAESVEDRQAEVVIVVEGHFKALSVLSVLRERRWSRSAIVVSVTSATSWSDIAQNGITVRGRVGVLALDPDVRDESGVLSRVRGVVVADHWRVWSSDTGGKVDDELLRGASVESLLSPRRRWLRPMSEVSGTLVPRWVVPDFVPSGCLTLVEGLPGTGKSFFSLAVVSAYVVASVTGEPSGVHLGHDGVLEVRGDPTLPCVGYINTEDNPAILRGRVEWLLRRVDDSIRRAVLEHLLMVTDHVLFPLEPARLDELRAELADSRTGIVVVDTLSNHVAPSADMHSDAAARSVLRQVKALAPTSVVVRHWRKSASADPIERGAGSIGLAADARSVISVENQVDDATGRERGAGRIVKPSYGTSRYSVYGSIGEFFVVPPAAMVESSEL